MKKEIFEKLMEKGWKDPRKVLPDIVKGTKYENFNQGKSYPVQIENWLESEPVLIIEDAEEFKPELLRLSRLTVLRMEYYDDNSGVLLDESTGKPDWYIGTVGYEPERAEYYENEKILAWRPLDDLLFDNIIWTIERSIDSFKWDDSAEL